MKNIAILFLLFMTLGSVTVFSDDDAEAQKLYLQASRLQREGQYSEAKILYDKILNDYVTSSIALQADEKLSEVIKLLEEASLPSVPGVYISTVNGELIKVASKEPIYKTKGLDKSWKELGGKNFMDYMNAKNNAPYYNYVLWLGKHPEVPYDEISSIIVFDPDITKLSSINLCYAVLCAGQYDLAWTSSEPENTKGKPRHLVYPEWTLIGKSGEIKSANLIKVRLKEGMYEIKYPSQIDIGSPERFVVAVGETAYPFTIQSTFADMIRARYISNPSKAHIGVSQIEEKLQEEPDDITLNSVFVELLLVSNQPDRAYEAAQKLNKLVSTADSDSQNRAAALFKRVDLNKTLKDLREIYTDEDSDVTSGLALVDHVLELKPGHHEGLFAKAHLLQRNGDLDNAAQTAELAVNAAKKIKSRDKKSYEKYRDRVLCEAMIAKAIKEHLDPGQDLKSGIDMAKKACKKDKNSYYAKSVLAKLYFTSGKYKDARKQSKKAMEMAEKSGANDVAYYRDLYAQYEKAEKDNK